MVLDNILRPRYEDRCPRYDKMYNWYIKKSPEATEMYNKYGHLFDFWAKQTGKKVKHIEHVFSIYKKLLSQKQQNQTLVFYKINFISSFCSLPKYSSKTTSLLHTPYVL